jgi:transcription initiation factor IIE alpha subunit
MLVGIRTFSNTFDCDKFIENHKCNRCWNHLVKVSFLDEEGKRNYRAECSLCGTSVTYIANRYIDEVIQKDRNEIWEVKKNLVEYLPKKKLESEEIMNILGF